MSTSSHNTAGRNYEATAITTGLVLPCGLACAGSVVAGLDDIVMMVVTVLGALTAPALVVRRMAWCMREHRQDRADILIAARWWAEHASLLLTAVSRAHLGAALPIEVGHVVRAVA